ncbi:carboxymuconolactone decarboxylase family protein [Novosphingobium sp. 9U]|uniref:carboxymuconolactone decarboxylase family protein n=1 Tax=Novosphingobium sp. 9U TaxID=2653158 RepID=UPI0012EF9FB8|nr:carboxymuconolactone decarboxylase family protein [Novosphingobium sp. 9U]VWX47059.1 Carboxymuconolactone decarboxylase [Novosphingobium sp. 9U]
MKQRDLGERMAQITAGCRLSALPADQLDARHHAAIERLRLIYDYPEGLPLDPFYAVLAHSPEFFASYMDLGVAITAASALPARWRELLILRTGWLCGAPYQWGEHVISARSLGIDATDVERITLGSNAPGWNAEDEAILRAAEELHADAMIGEDTWSALAVFLDERQLLELPMIVGHYHTTAFVQNALRISLTAHNRGLTAV